MPDPFLTHPVGRTSPGVRHFAITPSDGADLADRPRVIRAGGAGAINVRDEAGVDVVYTVVAGEVLNFSPVRILATSTTATGLVGWL